MLLTRVIREENKLKGGDSFVGGRLRALVRGAGFQRVVSEPGYSAMFSDVKAVGRYARAGLTGDWRPMLIRHGISIERCDQLLEEISIWAESEDSVYAAAQCAVIGWKP
jgi:hypothetical protein